MRKLIGRILLWFIDAARQEVTHTFEIGGLEAFASAHTIAKQLRDDGIIPLGDPEKLH